MKNRQKGFITPFLIGIVSILLISGGVYIYSNKKVGAPVVNDNVPTTTTNIGAATSAVPMITSISPTSGPIGTIITIKGNNLNGFEGDMDAMIENSENETAVLLGLDGVPSFFQANNQTMRVKIENSICRKGNTYTGLPCESYLNITPGIYNLYVYPWGKMSNKIQFTVVATTTQNTKIYENIKYGFEFEYDESFGDLKQDEEAFSFGLGRQQATFSATEIDNIDSKRLRMAVLPMDNFRYSNTGGARITYDKKTGNCVGDISSSYTDNHLFNGAKGCYLLEGDGGAGSVGYAIPDKDNGRIIEIGISYIFDSANTDDVKNLLDSMISSFKFTN